jgi:hypothetical protein
MNDKDLLNIIRKLDKISIDLDWVKLQLSNHLKHHQAKEIAMLGITGTAIIALIIALV